MHTFQFYLSKAHFYLALLLEPKADTLLVKEPCYNQTNMYGLYKKMTIYVHFSIQSIHFWSSTINHVVTKTVL